MHLLLHDTMLNNLQPQAAPAARSAAIIPAGKTRADIEASVSFEA